MKRTSAVFVVGAFVLVACGGGGADETTASTTEPSATTTEQPADDEVDTDEDAGDESVETEPTRVTATSDDGDLTLEVESNESSIWMTTDNGEVCSPAEPAVALFDVVVDGSDADDVTIEAFLAQPDAGEDTDEDRDRRSVEFIANRDGAEWRAVVGPFEATRSSVDRRVEVTVTARIRSGERAVAVVELDVLAPERCENDGAERRPTPPVASVEVRTEPSDGLIVGSGRPDCAARPTELGLGISTRGPIVALTVSGTLPDGTPLARSLTPGSNVRARLGPFRGGANLPDATPFTVSVAAIDALGRSMTEQVTATLVRPEPCESTTTSAPNLVSTTAPGQTDPGTDLAAVSVATSPNPAEIWATATGRCPAGATSLSVTVEAPSAATAVGAEARTANGGQVQVALTRSGDRWSGTVGPFAGWSGMADTTALEVRLTVAAGSVTRTIEVPARLRRSASCGGGATTSTAPATTTTTAVATTTTSTTTSTTTTAPTTTTTTLAPIEVTAGASPGQVTASGPCTAGTVLTISASTSGPVTEVGAQVTLATGASQNVPLSGGAGSWSATVGPFPGSANMPEQSPISITVVARDGTGRTTTATTGATLLKPPSC